MAHESISLWVTLEASAVVICKSYHVTITHVVYLVEREEVKFNNLYSLSSIGISLKN